MKINVEIDCTPQEARQMMGLPDLEPMQKAMMEKLQGQMDNAVDEMDAQAILKQWMPGGSPGIDQMQKFFWSALQSATEPKGSKGKKGDDK